MASVAAPEGPARGLAWVRQDPALSAAVLALWLLLGLFYGTVIGRKFKELGLGGTGFALDVNSPAGELGGKPDILPLLANGKRKLVVCDYDFKRFIFLIDVDLGNSGRLKRIAGKTRRIFRPGDDIDFLTAELRHDVLNPGTPHSNACTNRIHIRIVGVDRNFGPASRLAHH